MRPPVSSPTLQSDDFSSSLKGATNKTTAASTTTKKQKNLLQKEVLAENRRTILINSESDGRLCYGKNGLISENRTLNKELIIKRSETLNCGNESEFNNLLNKKLKNVGADLSVKQTSEVKLSTESNQNTSSPKSDSGQVPKNIIVNKLDEFDSEIVPLITPNDSPIIKLRKTKDQSLIFTIKEDKTPIVKLRSKLDNRKSFQWPISDSVSDFKENNNNNTIKRIHSWYGPGYDTLFEDSEQNFKDKLTSANLAGTKSYQFYGGQESASLLDQQQLNQGGLIKSGLTTSNSGGLALGTAATKIRRSQQQQQQQNQLTNSIEGPHAISLGGPAPRRRRFEQLFKSFIGRKSSSKEIVPIIQESKISKTISENSLTNLTESKKNTISTTSLNHVQHKLWSVVPLLKREGSCASLNPTKSVPLADKIGLRKCNTVVHLSQSSFLEPIKPLNRLRNNASIGTCSRCSSLLSLAASGSRYSLNVSNGGFVSISGGDKSPTISDTIECTFSCKLCLGEVKQDKSTKIGNCGCSFCTECMTAYVEFEIVEGAYEISCPDAMCPTQGILTINEILLLASPNLMDKHLRYRLNREVELDKNRTWCPKAGCETVCLVGPTPTEKSVTIQQIAVALIPPCAVHCPTCEDDFCSGCKKPWHPTMSCEENTRRLAADGQDQGAGISFDSDLIKCCPMCAVPIEKDEGCAQMMCKRCKHVFCWYCLASLDDDFLLRHYDKGPCKNKLGHSRASVVWHRAQVIGIFAGFGILLLVASPLLLLAAPCIVCCKCRICSGATKLEENENDNEFDEAVALQRNIC